MLKFLLRNSIKNEIVQVIWNLRQNLCYEPRYFSWISVLHLIGVAIFYLLVLAYRCWFLGNGGLIGCDLTWFRQDAFTLDVLEVPQGSGSGFVWDKQGHIVTNYHVIRGASDLRLVYFVQVMLFIRFYLLSFCCFSHATTLVCSWSICVMQHYWCSIIDWFIFYPCAVSLNLDWFVW